MNTIVDVLRDVLCVSVPAGTPWSNKSLLLLLLL
jgi:hypothetical protein